MDLCRHHPQAGNKERERKTVLNNSRTRAAKAKAQEEYTAVYSEVRRSIKKDKRDYIDDLVRQAETVVGQGNLRDLYLVTKKLTGKFQQTVKPVMDKNGNPLTTTKEQLKRWAEHFRELLNRPIPDSPPDIPSAETELPISCDKPSKAEIKKAIMTLRSGRAAGPDEIPAEAIKADIETAVNILCSLFSKIWEKEKVPVQWKEGIIIKLPKKKETWGTAATREGSCSCHRQARFSTEFCWRGWRRLSTHHAPVIARQGFQQSSAGEDEGGCRPQAPRSAGRLPAEQILCRPDRQPSHHHGTVTGVEPQPPSPPPPPPPPPHQLHRLWEGLWQCRQRDNVEVTETLWRPREDNLPHPVHLSGHELQNCPRRPAVWKFRGENWSSAGVPAFTVPLPPDHRLDHEDHYNR